MAVRKIYEVEGLSYLEDIAEEYEVQYGSLPFDVSHWDPSDYTTNTLLKHLILPPLPLASPYIYSYYTGVQQQVIGRLGFQSEPRNCLLVHAGTNAMLLAICWLKALSIDRVVILCPAYFPVFYDAEIMGLNYRRIYIRRNRAGWYLPQQEIIDHVLDAPSKTAVWVTNPVYCTGVYLSESDISFLGSLLESGVTIVADECLSKNEYALGRKLGNYERFLGIYSPHKSVCLNAIKFAVITFDTKYEEFFDSWADVLAGGLSASGYSAIFHFLGDNFLHYQSIFCQHIEPVRDKVLGIISKRPIAVNVDKNSLGHFMTCYVPTLPGNLGNDRQFLRKLVSHTGAILIPGIRNHFDPEMGFNFRINLARGCPQFYSALNRIIDYLNDVSLGLS
jgi:aspartate/methionine/tyrosine aminotransferase